MVATFYFAKPYDSKESPLREYRVPCHDEQEAWLCFHRAHPDAISIKLVSFEKRRTMHKIYLVNVQTLGAKCGYGEGRTREEAIENALAKARQIDPAAYYDRQSGSICFAGGINS